MILALNIVIVLLILFIIFWFWIYKPKTFTKVEAGEIEIYVENGVYKPDTILAKVGQPLSIHFILKDDTPCASTVIFSDFNISKELSKAHPETIELTLDKPGEFGFACPMGMYRGKLIVK